ncbi:MAG: thiamine pyrophosphate-binding protein [candidate division KSB1 bacterium]|nr:thiamine pyrophosphate-binding protein [candidate division KSB1 bacterium]
MKTMLGGEIIAHMLQKEGVQHVFGIIDGTYFGLYSTLQKYGIKLISPRHEASAVHMAGAYARLTGRLGVCIASNGPGVANALSGVAVENAEGNRVLLITSTRRVGIGYPDRGGTYQYFNQVGAMKALCKWSGVALYPARIPELMRRAFRKSYQGRPGVVHVDVPEDLLNNKTESPLFWEPAQYRHVHPMAPLEALVEQAADLLAAAEMPILHVGSGIVHSGGYDTLQAIAELLQAPVLTSWGARGALPETHELAIPMVHIKLCHQIRNTADVVLTLGSRLGETDWWGKPPYWAPRERQKMIQVDIDEEIVGMNKPADLIILSDIRLFLERLHEALKSRTGTIRADGRKNTLAKWAREKKGERKKWNEKLADTGSPMLTAHVPAICREVFDDSAICVIDGGNAAVWSHFYHEARQPNTVLQTAKFGMLGAGVPQALGASVAAPDRQVYCIIGDGAMAFHIQEIETAVRNRLPVVYLVLCDKQWGMVKMSQQMALKPVKALVKKSLGADEFINTDFQEIEFHRVAEAMGARGERVVDPAELRPALERSLAADTCTVIHVDVDPVKHMWAPGLMHFKEMHQEPKGK